MTDQLRRQSEEDVAHHDRLDRAIELLTMLVASSVSGQQATEPAELGPPPANRVIGGSVDPALLDTTSDDRATIDLTAAAAPERVPETPPPAQPAR